MDNPNFNYFPGRLLCFDGKGSGDTTPENTWLQIEITESGNGFVELAFDDRNERCYVAFRVSDLLRSIKEHGHD